MLSVFESNNDEGEYDAVLAICKKKGFGFERDDKLANDLNYLLAIIHSIQKRLSHARAMRRGGVKWIF